jgi:hypothetical protein
MGDTVVVIKLACSPMVVKSGLPSILWLILKHPGTKENGKNVGIKAIWHADQVVIDSL